MFPLFNHLFPLSSGLWGEGEKGCPTRIDHFDLGQDMVMLKAAVASRQRQAVTIALRAACSGIKIQDYTHGGPMASVTLRGDVTKLLNT